MEIEIRKVVVSDLAVISLENIYHYGIETFSLASASVFVDEVTDKIESLERDYLLYPECRFLETKGKLYRNIIFGNYLIIYRITKSRIEVLNIIHSSRSISFIKSSRGIKL